MSGSSPYLYRMTNDGYSSANPLANPFGKCGDPPGSSPCVDPYHEINGGGAFSDNNPTDQGSMFDLSLPSLVPGASVQFPLFYGAAASKTAALSTLTAVDADAYALALPESQPSTGTPNTFILTFRLAGVTVTNPPPPPVVPPPTITPPSTLPPASRVNRTKTPVTRVKPLRFEVLKHRYRRKVIEVTLRCSADCEVSASGKVRMLGNSKNFKLKKYSKKLKAGVKTKIKLRLTKSSKRALRRAHAKRADLFARLSLRAVGGQGPSVKRKPAFKL